MRFFGHPATFAVLYILFMLPTYYLPWVGSNSAVVNATAAGSDEVVNAPFWAHLICIAILIGITMMRGKAIHRQWLIIFPILAGIFDLVPGINWLFGIPTTLHLIVIILGVALSPVIPMQAQTST